MSMLLSYRCTALDRLPSPFTPVIRNKLPPINSDTIDQYLSVPGLRLSFVRQLNYLFHELLNTCFHVSLKKSRVCTSNKKNSAWLKYSVTRYWMKLPIKLLIISLHNPKMYTSTHTFIIYFSYETSLSRLTQYTFPLCLIGLLWS